MTVPFEVIRPEFERIRDCVLSDLTRVVRLKTGGNYLAVALITCACDALANLKYGKAHCGELFFAEVVPREWKPLAGALYRAMRNGIVHVYETKSIRLNSKRIEVVISWHLEPHFHRSTDGGRLYINVRNLAKDFRTAITRFEAELKDRPQLRKVFESSMRVGREMSVNKRERSEWVRCLCTMPVASKHIASVDRLCG